MCVVGRPTESLPCRTCVYSMDRSLRLRSIERYPEYVPGRISATSYRYMHAQKSTSTVEVRQPSDQWYNMVGLVPHIPQRGL